MKYKPLLFSTPMVQALLEDRKQMTRRVMKPQPYPVTRHGREVEIYFEWDASKKITDLPIQEWAALCPYGQIGDVLWVRETFYAYGKWELSGKTKTGKQKWDFKDLTFWNKNMPDGGYKYADNPPSNFQKGKSTVEGYYKRPSLFMPKAACRIFLQITDRRVESLQGISEEDAIKEGIKSMDITDKTKLYFNYETQTFMARNIKGLGANESFETLWQSINGKESWESNPWVWVISFKRIDKPNDFNN
jgi:hypothetical protein